MSDDSIPKVTYELFCLDGPPDVEFLVYRMWLIEHLNAPFELSLEIATESPVDVRALLGVSIELVIAREDHTRSVFAVISQAELVGSTLEQGDSGNAGQIVIRVGCGPAVTLLRQGTASRIFQEQSVQDVLTAVLTPPLGEYSREFDAGKKVRGTELRDYCVQYHESDFDFAIRLLEEEGISYYFRHDTEKRIEVLTLAYDNDAYGDIANTDGSRIFPLTRIGGAVAGLESIHHFTWRAALVTTGVKRMDYDFMEPFAPLIEEQVDTDDKQRTRRLYFGGLRRYIADDVKARQQDHLEVAQMGGEVFSGASDAIDFRAGAVFEVDGDLADGLDRAFLVTRVVHTGFAPEALHFTQVGEDEFSDDMARYGNRFECIPSATTVRPALVTTKPKIEGVQTGIVVGPSSEEIHTDEFGRIIVQFHWEEESTYNEQSSCWVRVSQSWAGPSWGAMFIPRIGMEVVVTFIEGNPDRPLVTGCVYNGKAAVPYTLPLEKTKSTIKSNTSPGGNGFNEFRFEDAAGKEEVFLHAQKDHNEVVRNNMSTSVGNDQALSVGNDRTKQIKGNELVAINKDRTSTIDGSDAIHIKGSYNLLIDGGSVLGKGQDPPELGTGMTITGRYNISVSDKYVVGVGAVCPASAADTKLIMDTTTVLLETTSKITFKVGASEIVMTPGAITMTSPHIMATSAGKSTLDLEANVDLKSSGTVTMHNDGGAKVVLSSAEALTEATQIGLISSNGEVLADGSGVGLKGTTIDLKGSATVSISGGGATGSFAGGMVKLN